MYKLWHIFKTKYDKKTLNCYIETNVELHTLQIAYKIIISKNADHTRKWRRKVRRPYKIVLRVHQNITHFF